MRQVHTLEPIYDCNSKVLILGSFPSVISRKEMFYYANKNNRFWRVLENIFDVSLVSVLDKKNFLLFNNIALWDVVSSCDIIKSYDARIKDVKVNDILKLVKSSRIKMIFLNGKKAHFLYKKYLAGKVKANFVSLPSTSSANAKYSLNDLVEAYTVIKEYLKSNG